MATVTDVLDRVYRRTAALAKRKDDPDIAANVDDLYVLTPILKDGAIYLAVETGRLEADVAITVVADQFEYDIHDLGADGATPPTNIRAIRAVQLNEVFLEHRDGVDVLANARQKTAASGAPTQVGFHRDKMVVYPIPTAEIATATPTFYLYYIMASAHTEADEVGWTTSENPPDNLIEWLPVEMEAALVWYIIAGWFDSIAEFALAGEYRKMYLDRSGQMKRELRRKHKRMTTTRRRPRYF